MTEKVTIPLDEQEFLVNFGPLMGKDCEVYTTIPSEMKRLEKLVEKYPDTCTVVKDDKYSYTVRMPFKLVKPRKPRAMTDEQRLAASERMKAIVTERRGA